ncbi:hypothetical protein QWZ08_06760 [Ferruginibacter paludis]|nr:hypothetical protein [Ferruginibacter paludis]MDN3655316.1 hypothetical protein [Ferruginibacter paludis]
MPQKISNADADGSMTFFSQRWMNITGRSPVTRCAIRQRELNYF